MQRCIMHASIGLEIARPPPASKTGRGAGLHGRSPRYCHHPHTPTFQRASRWPIGLGSRFSRFISPAAGDAFSDLRDRVIAGLLLPFRPSFTGDAFRISGARKRKKILLLKTSYGDPETFYYGATFEREAKTLILLGAG